MHTQRLNRLTPPRDVPRYRLFHSRAAALNQNHQNDDYKRSSSNSDNRGAIHAFFPFFFL
jgi:hypothetical protein